MTPEHDSACQAASIAIQVMHGSARGLEILAELLDDPRDTGPDEALFIQNVLAFEGINTRILNLRPLQLLAALHRRASMGKTALFRCRNQTQDSMYRWAAVSGYRGESLQYGVCVVPGDTTTGWDDVNVLATGVAVALESSAPAYAEVLFRSVQGG